MTRLDKLLADTGKATRSEARALIRAGRVTVDNENITAPEFHIDPETQRVALDGELLRAGRLRYIMLNKPSGYLSATEDRDKSTVMELLSPELQRLGLFPVGRLDKDTTGLLLLTNDGDFAHRVMSPASGVWKRYKAQLDKPAEETDVSAFSTGVTLKDGTVCLPAGITILQDATMVLVDVREGKYHQVKRMLAACGKKVITLERVSIGRLELDIELPRGGYKELNAEDLNKIFTTIS